MFITFAQEWVPRWATSERWDLTGLWACKQAMSYRGYKEDGEPGSEGGWSWRKLLDRGGIQNTIMLQSKFNNAVLNLFCFFDSTHFASFLQDCRLQTGLVPSCSKLPSVQFLSQSTFWWVNPQQFVWFLEFKFNLHISKRLRLILPVCLPWHSRPSHSITLSPC